MQEGAVSVPQLGPRLLVLTDVGEDAAEGRAGRIRLEMEFMSQSFLPWHLLFFLAILI